MDIKKQGMMAIIGIAFCASILFIGCAHQTNRKCDNSSGRIRLNLRSQVLRRDKQGRNYWQVLHKEDIISARETAIIICDMWNTHWSKGTVERINALAPRIDGVITIARRKGIHIIHAPAEVIWYYEKNPARKRMKEMPFHQMPSSSVAFEVPSLPLDISDGGSDTNQGSERVGGVFWSRQHPAITIDPARDGISADLQEIYNFFQENGIKNVILTGVAVNWCILYRPFGLINMRKLGMHVMLARDLTDGIYNPAMSPYVNYEEGIQLMIGYIEKFICPTIESRDLIDD